MSTRWYPLYQKGNPQLRVFLPNFWMKVVKPYVIDPKPNQVHFHVSMEMSPLDVRSYLEKIYKVPVVSLKMEVRQGRFYRVPRRGYIVKEDDFKHVEVTLPKNMKFEFPDIFPTEKIDKELEGEKKNLEAMKKNYKDYLKRNEMRPDVPGWFL